LQSALIGCDMNKFEAVHENETGYILVLASDIGNSHHATETGFFFCSGEPKVDSAGIQEEETG